MKQIERGASGPGEKYRGGADGEGPGPKSESAEP